jgi:phosphoglucosamine mutase
MADEQARKVDGDLILAIIARDWKERGILTDNTVVMTTISNLGVEKHLNAAGISVHRSDVGDRNVIYAMREHNTPLGGEPCGHIIVHHASTTGDGMMAALQVLAVMKHKDVSLGKLCSEIEQYPSVTCDIEVREKIPVKNVPVLQAALDTHQKKLGTTGRIIVRYSGTELKFRILVEGRDERMIKRMLNDLAVIARKELGTK